VRVIPGQLRRPPEIEMTKINAKEVGGMVRCYRPAKGHQWFPYAVLVSGLLLCGCASVEPKSSAPEFGSGVAEYKQLTEGALTAVTATLTSLDRVTSQPVPCPPEVIAAFSHQVQQLQIDSLRIRARGQAILVRGDAYFATWSESIASIKDPRIRESVQRHHPQLEECFVRIRADSKRAGAAFKPFLSGLRTLQVHWEKDPGSVKNEANEQLVRTTREYGHAVLQELKSVREELLAMQRMITPANSVSKD